MATLTELKQSRQKITRRVRGNFYTDIYTTTDPGSSSEVDVSGLPQLRAGEGTEVKAAALAIAPFNNTTISPLGGGLSVDAHIGDWITINAGTGANQQRKVISNTTTAYTISTGDGDWTTTPDATSSFNVREQGIGTSILTTTQVDRNWRPGQARVIAKYEPLRLGGFLRDRPGRAMLLVTISADEIQPAFDLSDPTAKEVNYENLIVEGDVRKYVRWRPIEGKATQYRGRVALKLSMAKYRNAPPTIDAMKNLVGTINAAGAPLMANAAEKTLLFVGAKTNLTIAADEERRDRDADYNETIDLIDMFFLYEPDGWNAATTIQRQELRMQKFKEYDEAGDEAGSSAGKGIWLDSGPGAGKNYPAILYATEDFSVFNALVEWSDLTP